MKKVVMVAVAAALLGGCAVKDQVSYSLQSLQTVPLSAFQPSESNPNQRVYKEPGVDLRQYNEVLLDPLQFIRQENGQWYLLTTSEQSLIGRYYHDKFQSELISHGVKIATVDRHQCHPRSDRQGALSAQGGQHGPAARLPERQAAGTGDGCPREPGHHPQGFAHHRRGDGEDDRPVGCQPCQTAGGQSGALTDRRV